MSSISQADPVTRAGTRLPTVPSSPRAGGASVPWAIVETTDGHRHRLGIGDMIGRLPTAALAIDDPRVSEAHALVSLRHGGLHLLSLRRMIAVAGKPRPEVCLTAGLVVELAAGLGLTVVEVHVPETLLAIALPGQPPRPLPPATSVLTEPLRIVAGHVPDAPLHLWEAGQGWRARHDGGPARAVAPGDSFVVGGARIAITALPVVRSETASAECGSGVFDPLRIIGHYDVVELHRRQRPPLMLGGIGAQIVSELIACGGPLHWSVLARDLWPAHKDEPDLRHRWDVALGRLRAKLRDAGVRGDLLRADHSGQLTLVLYDGDAVEDRS